jgi:putative nucleotidyltransferase with HDIG domain
MSLEPSHSEQEALAETLRRYATRMTGRERLSVLVATCVFFFAELALFVIRPPGHISVLPVLLCVGVLVVAGRVRIDLPLGYTMPTQLGFVPLLFAAPAPYVPLLVCAALTVAGLVDVALGRLRADRLWTMPANSCWALGPAAVFALSGVSAARAGAGLLVTALAAQFAVDFIVSVLRQRLVRRVPLTEQLADMWVYGIDAGLSCLGLVVAEAVGRTPVAVLSLVPLLAMLAVFAQERRGRLESMIELSNAYRGTALVLGDVVEADDGYTGEHCKSVVALALDVAEELQFEPRRLRNLEFGALLHDVGKIAMPKDIINKPGKLDPHEWTIIKTHTLEGQKMLDRVGGFMREVGRIVRSHHERWDGSGYPDGLAGPDIPIEARVVSACDTWNAMRTDRVYRKALPYDVAMAELISCSGTQLDPVVVAALVRVIERDERRLGPAPGQDGAEPDALAA